MKTTGRFNISKWIMVAFSVVLNVLIIVYSCFSEDTTNKISRVFSNAFASLINNLTQKENADIKLEKIEINLSNQETYVYNYLNGYEVNEIPLGSAKQINCQFSPSDATDTSITYSAYPDDMVSLNQSNSTVSVVGMKVGECLITAKSNDGGFESSVKVKVVETIAPTSYEISLANPIIPLGTTQTIDFDIDGGVLTHDELVNFRYYDTRKLTYASSNETIATVDNYGVIYPISVGDTTITVSNGDYSKSINVSVTSGSTPTPYSNLSISGSDVCYANDMILDQSSKKNHYQLTPKDGETELNPEDFIWESSNELLVRVDKHGIMRGFRKMSADDEIAVITVTSKLTGQSVSKTIVVKEQVPTRIDYKIEVGGETYWNPKFYTFSIGDNIDIAISLNPYTQNRKVVVSSTNENVVSFTNEDQNIVLHMIAEGTSIIKVISVANQELSFEFECVVTKYGAINKNNFVDFNHTIRKIFGHAFLFMIAQVFTLLAFYMFYSEQEWYVWTSMSLGEGLFISGLSELIQFFIPSRSGAWLDVLIDFSGVVVGAALALLGIFIVKKIIAKRRAKQVESK